MRRIAQGALVVLATAALLIPSAQGSGTKKSRSWQVTITNLTGGQPLSPPLLVIHSRRADVWSLRTVANHGVAAIAEDANNAVLESALPGLPGIRSVETGAGGPIPPGASRTYTVQTRGNSDRLTLLTMLVNTNDAFTGLDSAHLRRGFTRSTMGYDSGSEVNNERAAYIPGPCCGNPFVRDPEGALIRMHEGITGRGDLSPAVYDWNGPVARIRVSR
jgi:hypothetical protein